MDPRLLTLIEPGKGNLDARAMWAAMVGPYRLAHGANRALRMAAGQPQQVASNPAAGQQVMFVGVALQPSTIGPIATLFASTADILGNTNVPAVMISAVGSLSGVSYSAILLPGDELYAQTAVAANLVAFSVGF